MARGIDRGLGLAAVLLAASMAAAALHDASQAWDAWYYHLPFAARIWRIVPPSAYVLGAANEPRFHGFPLLGEALQGLLWKISGHPEATNLVAFGSVGVFVAFARARFGIAPHLLALALLAVPLVHVHATASYVDLPANLALSALVLLTIEAWAAPDDAPPPSGRTLLLAACAAAVAVNMKTLAEPVAALALGALAVRARRTILSGPRAVAVAALALGVVFATPLKDLLLHGNPWYPLRVTLVGHALPGTEAPYASSPDWLASAPRPARFVASVLEIGARPLSDHRRWTIDQWAPSGTPAYRIGGFFGAYVVVHLAALAWQTARGWRSSRRVRACAVGFAALTAVVAASPQSHELRYYLDWMVVLVTINLWLAASVERHARALGLVAVGALGVVLWVTDASYAYPSGSSFAELVKERVDEHAVAGVAPGDAICVAREPYDFLWAARFHPEARGAYVVREAERPSECAGFPPERVVR